MIHRRSTTLGTLVVALAVGLAACTGSASPTPPPATPQPSQSTPSPSMAPSATPVPSPASVTTEAANLRADLDFLLGEHLLLAAKATGAALGGRAPEFQAYANLLNTNGTDLGSAIGSLYGDAARDEWNRIWSAHNGFFVDYTTGVATKDQAK